MADSKKQIQARYLAKSESEGFTVVHLTVPLDQAEHFKQLAEKARKKHKRARNKKPPA